MIHILIFLLYFFFTIMSMFLARGTFSKSISLKNIKKRVMHIAIQASIISSSIIIPFLDSPNTQEIIDLRIQLVIVCIISGFLLQFNYSKTKKEEYRELDNQIE